MRTTLVSIAAVGFVQSATALTGQVVDKQSAPLSGVTVSLVVDGATVLTGIDGKFSLQPNEPLNASRADRSPIGIHVREGMLLFDHPFSGSRNLQTLDVAGNTVASSSGILGMDGKVAYDVFGARPRSPGVYLVQYRFGSTTGAISVVVTHRDLTISSIARGTPLMRSSASGALDSLSFSKIGYLTRRLPVTNEEQGVGEVVLYPAIAGPKGDFGIPWNPAVSYGTLTDERDGQVYRTVRIGTQNWMAENLNFKRPGTDSGIWYFKSPDSGFKYGRLYSWVAAMDLPSSCRTSSCRSMVKLNHQGICPNGWHVPRDDEWTDVSVTRLDRIDSSGLFFKSTTGWKTSGNGLDRFGFRALPGGFGYNDFRERAGELGIWWSASEDDQNFSWSHRVYYDQVRSDRYSNDKSLWYSVRCLEN